MIDIILKLLEDTNTSAYKLTKELGLSNSAISDWKNGKAKPSLDTIIKIANYFNVSVDFLIGRKQNNNTSVRLRHRVNILCNEVDFQISDFERKTQLDFLSFRAWLNGYGDYCENIDSLLKLANYFEVPTDYLLGATNEEKKSDDLDGQKKIEVSLSNLFIRMEELNKNAKTVSAETGISTGNISDWKSGRSMPSASKLVILAKCLDCSVDYLLGIADMPTSAETNPVLVKN